jgi:glycosyltransferase involved in cell wall biosynthesis
MRILFGCTTPYFPQHFGGIATNIDNLCRGLIARGHDVVVLARLGSSDATWIKNRFKSKLFGFGRSYDLIHGYRVFREWNVSRYTKEVCKSFNPDIFVGHGGGDPQAFFTEHPMEIPHAVHLHGMLPVEHAEELCSQGVRNFISCSEFIRSRLLQRIGGGAGFRTPVIYNAFVAESYKTDICGDYVTFVNPNRQKGLEIALRIAKALPNIPFLFIKGWSRSDAELAEFFDLVSGLKNLVIEHSTLDMMSVYRRTKLLIIPSQVEEGAGRVIIEAQISGIPVVGSDIGGIPEMIGDGGVVLAPRDLDSWVRTVSDVWRSSARWQSLSRLALANSRRDLFSYDKVIEQYENFLITCIAGEGEAPREQ